MTEAALADELERGATHPLKHVDLLWAVSYTRFKCGLELDARSQLVAPFSTKMGSEGACLVGDGVEHRRKVPHVRAREDRGEHLALLLVGSALSKQEPGADNEVPHAVRA